MTVEEGWGTGLVDQCVDVLDLSFHCVRQCVPAVAPPSPVIAKDREARSEKIDELGLRPADPRGQSAIDEDERGSVALLVVGDGRSVV